MIIIIELVGFMFYLVLHLFVFFIIDSAPTEIYTLSLHDALPICLLREAVRHRRRGRRRGVRAAAHDDRRPQRRVGRSVDRKSTRLNSSHSSISYAVFCLKKKKARLSTTGSTSHARST